MPPNQDILEHIDAKVAPIGRLTAMVYSLLVGAFALGVWVAGVNFGLNSSITRISALEKTNEARDRHDRKVELLLVRIALKLNIDTSGIESE